MGFWRLTEDTREFSLIVAVNLIATPTINIYDKAQSIVNVHRTVEIFCYSKSNLGEW